jgi:methionyl-tRNA synthetase
VSSLGTDGTRYVVLREVPFDRDAEVSWDSFVRRYNADLANDFGNLVNRTVSMTSRYLAADRPSIAAPDGRLAAAWRQALGTYEEAFDDCLLHDALGALWEFVGEANRFVDAQQPWSIAKSARTGDEQALVRLRGILGDLVEACRLVALAAAPFVPNTAPRVLAQLGYEYVYRRDGNGGPPLADELRWGAHAAERGRMGQATPLFPRLETEVTASARAPGPETADRPDRGEM